MSFYTRPYPFSPDQLCEVDLPYVEAAVIDQRDRVPAPNFRALTFFPDTCYDTDFSLASQLGEVTDQQPEALLFTAFSAIPTADIFRGIYQALGKELPVMGFVVTQPGYTITNAYRNKVYFDYNPNPNRYKLTRSQKLTPEDQTPRNLQHLEVELARLRTLLDGRQRVTIVEQYTNSGKTLHTAGCIVQLAGAAQPRAIAGRWYHHAASSEIDINGLTSPYALALQRIGHRLVEAAQTEKS